MNAIRFALRDDALYVEGSDVPIVHRALDRTTGFVDADERRRTPDDLELPALGMVVDSLREKGVRDALLEIDPEATYRELAGLASTIGQRNVEVWLSVATPAGPRALHLEQRRRQGASLPATMPSILELFVFAVAGEYAITVQWRYGAQGPRSVARGCHEYGPGPAVPRSEGGWSFDELSRCVRMMGPWVWGAPGSAYAASMVDVRFQPTRDMLYRDVIASMDALRPDADSPSPQDVYLTAPTPAP